MRRYNAIFVFAAHALAAQPGSVTQNTGGVCSQAVVAQGNVTITCSGLDEAQRKILLKVPGLLDQLLRKQVDQQTLYKKLDEVLKGQNIVLREITALREASTPRALSSAQFKAIVTELRQYKGQPYTIASISQDKEAYEFATAIHQLLTEAEWSEKDSALGRLLLVGQPKTGMELESASADDAAGLALLNALHRSGVEIAGRLDPKLAKDVVKIQIYSKGR